MISEQMQKAIDDILNTPRKEPTREEAMAALQACGVMTKEGEIADAFKNIFVKKKVDKYD